VTYFSVDYRFPLKTVSEANRRDHWATKARRVKEQRGISRMEALAHLQPIVRDLSTGRLSITLIRGAPRRLDTDNLASALKAVRDGIADFLGIDDGSEAVEWRYDQERCSAAPRSAGLPYRKGYVRVKVERK